MKLLVLIGRSRKCNSYSYKVGTEYWLCPTTDLLHCVMWTSGLTTRFRLNYYTYIQSRLLDMRHVLKEEIVIIDPALGLVLSGCWLCCCC